MAHGGWFFAGWLTIHPDEIPEKWHKRRFKYETNIRFSAVVRCVCVCAYLYKSINIYIYILYHIFVGSLINLSASHAKTNQHCG